jgi:hypothetical protein
MLPFLNTYPSTREPKLPPRPRHYKQFYVLPKECFDDGDGIISRGLWPPCFQDKFAFAAS